MYHLIAVTILWAFSFSLIDVYLAGQVDSYFAVLVRVLLASLVFLPFLRFRLLKARQALVLMAIGAVQLGIMYGFFYQSFLLLSVPEILLFTVLTPLYVTLLDDALYRRFTPFHLLTAAIAVLGAALIRFEGIDGSFWLGFLVVQGANLCFALGQVGYRRFSDALPPELPRYSVFAWFYLGAVLAALPAFLLFGDGSVMPQSGTQWAVLLWLGLVASGLGYFFWNLGATKVDAGTLAVMNNALVPAGLLVNILIWNRDVDLPRLIVGGAIIVLALWLNNWWQTRRAGDASAQA